MTPEELKRAVQPLIEACREFRQLSAHVATAEDAMRKFGEAVDRPKQREANATLAALAEVDRGAPVAPTARKHGIQPSTLFRARKRRREAAGVTAAELGRS
jgi:hypothetical protein